MNQSYLELGADGTKSIKAWVKDVPVGQKALQQLHNPAKLEVDERFQESEHFQHLSK